MHSVPAILHACAPVPANKQQVLRPALSLLRWDELDEHRSGGIAPVKLHLFVQVRAGEESEAALPGMLVPSIFVAGGLGWVFERNPAFHRIAQHGSQHCKFQLTDRQPCSSTPAMCSGAAQQTWSWVTRRCTRRSKVSSSSNAAGWLAGLLAGQPVSLPAFPARGAAATEQVSQYDAGLPLFTRRAYNRGGGAGCGGGDPAAPHPGKQEAPEPGVCAAA